MTDIDISDLPAPDDISDLPIPPESNGTKTGGNVAAAVTHPGGALDVLADRLIGGPVRGIIGGYKGLWDLARGKGVEAAAKSVTDVTSHELQPTTTGGEVASKVLASPYNPLNYIDESGEWLANKAADKGAPPWLSTAIRIGPDAISAYMGLKRGGVSEENTLAEPEAVARPPHPLAAAAEAEGERVAAMKTRGASLGLQLPEGGTPAQHAAAAVANREASNAIVRNALALPQDVEISPELLSKAREHYGSPAYQAIENIPAINLNKGYEHAIANVDLNQINEKFRPPTGGMLSGEDAVSMSRFLRNRANKLYAAAKGNPLLEDTADAHWDAAEAVENAVRDHLKANGQPELSENWDKARTYIAKTYSVQNALDGAGNVNVMNLKSQLMKNKPLSGDLEMLAKLGAKYPLAFKLTQESAPNPGVVRRAAAFAAPKVATAGGAAMGGALFGAPGAVGGAFAGKLAGDRMAEKILPPQ